MGFFNKFVKKIDRSKKQADDQRQAQKLRAKETDKGKPRKKELTLAELKAGQEKKPGEKEIKKTAKEQVKKDDTKDAYKFLLRPLVTEKGTYLGAENKYLFEVSLNANKIEIKKAIAAVYGVRPLKVNIINLSGKKVRYGRTSGETKATKKAIVTLKEGESIQVYEGV